jgi:uncharacterized protein involved in exopolysaccharide biosynthesis
VRKYVHAFLRHKILLTLPIVLAFVASMGLTLRQPKSWMSGATLWADSAVPNDSTVFAPSDPTPAAQTAGLFQELLHTRSFLMKVAGSQSAAGFLEGAIAPFDDITLGKVAGSVSVGTPGPQLVTLAVTAKDPEAATGLTTAFVEEFRRELTSTVQNRNQELLDFQQQRLEGASKALDNAQRQLTAYMADHPDSVPGRDSTLTQLEGDLVAAQDAYSTAQSEVNDAQLALSVGTSSSSLRVVDEPKLPTYPQSRRTAIMFGAVGGLVAGGAITLLLLLFFVATDASAREAGDIERDLGLRVLGSIEQVRSGRRTVRRAS